MPQTLRSVTFGLFFALFPAALYTTSAAAQAYPSKPVRMIIPFPPGGSNDVVGRMIAFQLSERLGRQVVADNQGGAGGIIGTDAVASSLPKLQSGLDIVHIPFKGGGPAMMDVIAGNTQIAIGSLIQTLPHIRSGRLKPLGVGSAKRVAALPDLPTISEAGVPGYEATNWWGIVAPAGTPRPVIERLHRELSVILASAETKKRFETEGGEAAQMSPEEFGRFIASETVKWAKVVKEAGIKPE